MYGIKRIVPNSCKGWQIGVCGLKTLLRRSPCETLRHWQGSRDSRYSVKRLKHSVSQATPSLQERDVGYSINRARKADAHSEVRTDG